MHSAAVALLAGVADPIGGFLALAPDDARLMAAIVTTARRLDLEDRTALADRLARQTSGQTITGVASVVRSALKALRRRG